jgi:hypothetical protein
MVTGVIPGLLKRQAITVARRKAYFTGFPRRGRTRRNAIGKPGGERCGTWQNQDGPETTASRVRFSREFRPGNERSDQNGHSRYCEPARNPSPAGCPRQKVPGSKPEYEKDDGSARRGRAWQSSTNLRNREAPKTAIARLRWKCDVRDKRLDPSGGANASPTREGRPR